MAHKGLRVPYLPEEEHLEQCIGLGRTVARSTRELVGGKNVESVI